MLPTGSSRIRRADNPHDELDDPFASAAVLQAHVDEGLKLARRHRPPRPVADFIPEHQGTLKMGYFLHKAREDDPSVDEERFRYHGPAPRSRETAVLMLADGCEAALRSLPPDTSERQAVLAVRSIAEARLRDGQLRKSAPSRAEMELRAGEGLCAGVAKDAPSQDPVPDSCPSEFPQLIRQLALQHNSRRQRGDQVGSSHWTITGHDAVDGPQRDATGEKGVHPKNRPGVAASQDRRQPGEKACCC